MAPAGLCSQALQLSQRWLRLPASENISFPRPGRAEVAESPPQLLQVGPEEDDRLLNARAHEENDTTVCLSCYGANSSPDQCCNTCEEVSC